MYTFKVENVSQRCKLLCSKKLKSVKFHICVFGTMKVFRRYIAYLKKNKLISFSYLSIPLNWAGMSNIDFSTVTIFLEFSLTFTDIHF